MNPKTFRSVLYAILLAAIPISAAPARAVILDDASLAASRNRLFADWAARNGQPDVCQAWQNLSCSAKGSFLTLTHRLGVSALVWDSTTPLDHVRACYAILGDAPGSSGCGGMDYHRIYVSMDDTLRSAMLYSNSGSTVTIDQNGNNYWKRSADWGGPHSPFNMSNETAYGHPRGQMHFWGSSQGSWTPVYRAGVPGIVDQNIMEIDQDYDASHPSSTECTYDTGGCDTCRGAWDRASFSDGTGRMIYARQHPNLPGWFAGPDYEWAPAGCERQWCGGCGTCEARTAWGYLLGRQARTCSDVPCDGTQNFVCTLDGGKKICTPPYGWVSTTPPPPPPSCNPDYEQACYDIGGNWNPATCECMPQCEGPTGSCAVFDYENCECRIYYEQ